MKNIPIRVLCVCSTLERGGIESMIMNLYRNINRELIQFDFVEHTDNKSAFDDEIMSLGGNIYKAPRYHIYNAIKYKKWWSDHLLKHPEHQIVHGHFYSIASVYLKEAKKMGRITICHSHTDRLSLIKRYWLRDIEKYSDYCLACSEQAGKCLFKNKNFTLINNAIDAKQFRYDSSIGKEYKEKYNLVGKLVIGTVGRFFQPKNPIGILNIFNDIYKKNNNARLLWVGDGVMRSEIERRIKDLKLEDVVILTGVRKDVREHLMAMDIYIMPSIREGVPVALIEAQAAGLPCFCSDAITNKVNITGLCHFLSLKSINNWSEDILNEKIDNRKDTYKEICKNGYDIQTTVQWLEKFYFEILNK